MLIILRVKEALVMEHDDILEIGGFFGFVFPK